MRYTWRIWLAPLVWAVLVMAGCGGDDQAADAGESGLSGTTAAVEQPSTSDPATEVPTSDPATTEPGTATEAATDDDTETASTSQAFATAPGSCLELPALLAGLPKSGFFVVTEDKIFECFGVSSFQSSVSFDGNLSDRSVSVVADSTQRLDDGVLLAEALTTEDGLTIENLIRFGDDIWLLDESGAWEETTLDLGYLFSEQGETRLSMGGALYILSVFGGGAEAKGEVEVNGLIVKLEGEIRAENVTLAGIPSTQVDPAILGLPADALDIVPDYALSYELFNFDHDIEITVPAAG